MSRHQKPTIAICYDFDGTLIKGNMQENSFIPEIDLSKKAFWKAVKEHAEKNDMDQVLAYMQLMLEKAREANIEFNKKSLQEYGKEITFFPGVENWFSTINKYCKNKINIEHYIISSGLYEMIHGSKIGKQFEYIFASGFVYDANTVAIFPARSINYTTKVQYLFRINKGIKNNWDDSAINKFTDEKERPIPFSRMIYIGDGDTDIPAMKMINYKGGYSIAVYPLKSGNRRTKEERKKFDTVKQLQKNNRAQFIAEADYNKDQELYNIITALIDRIINEHKHKMNLTTK